jgi:hypothetical protein
MSFSTLILIEEKTKTNKDTNFKLLRYIVKTKNAILCQNLQKEINRITASASQTNTDKRIKLKAS